MFKFLCQGAPIQILLEVRGRMDGLFEKKSSVNTIPGRCDVSYVCDARTVLQFTMVHGVRYLRKTRPDNKYLVATISTTILFR